MNDPSHRLTRRRFTALTATAAAAVPLGLFASRAPGAENPRDWRALTEAQWRERLSREEFEILREAGTERPGTSDLLHEKRAGTFVCAGCALPLFSSKTKYDSRTGWPSFWKPLEGAVETREDRSLLFLVRTEILCARCGGHLGHVFDDGPPPTGLRYCINGLALKFEPDAGAAS